MTPPFLVLPLFELSLVAVLGIVWIGWAVFVHLKNVAEQMREAGLRFCPHCGARCEVFYTVCPKRNRPLAPDSAKVK
ncbi:MAG: hypothetical protein COT00_03525 [Candidatus Omnitrophica bacterium CG07_land_8_20_14_0_80_50_8]|nr:MAG: hypothetical protein COT00_03525 [Candidatus Omnitrophica bacterium CG07_land_8_20_14_0_80_50_8]